MRRPIEFASFPPALSGRVRFGPYQAVVRYVVDADTIDVLVDLGFNHYSYATIRLRGVDAPELRTPEGKAARDRVRGLLPDGTPCVLTTYKDATTFGRYVADVSIDSLAGTVNLATVLVHEGHAVPSTRS